MKKVVIFGTGEYAELAYYYFTNDKACDFEVVGFVADDNYVKEKTFKRKPLCKLSNLKTQFPPHTFSAHVALSYSKLNQVKEEKFNILKSMGYELVSYVCSKGTVTWPDLNIGENCFILEQTNIQPTVTIGNNVMIWSSSNLSHNCVIKDHVYLASNVNISGHVVIGERSFIGVNAALKDFITIGKDVFVTMGTNVTKDIPEGSTITSTNLFESDNVVNKKFKHKYFGL